MIFCAGNMRPSRNKAVFRHRFLLICMELCMKWKQPVFVFSHNMLIVLILAINEKT